MYCLGSRESARVSFVVPRLTLLKEALAVVVHVVGGVKICTVSVGSSFLFVPSTSRKENTQTFIVEFKTFEQF
jgi:hypothetical protein